jgi:hypothetical protein
MLQKGQGMSGSNRAQAEKKSKIKVWFNNLFRTRLEIDTDKLLEMMSESNDNQVRGDSIYFYSRGGLQAEVLKLTLGRMAEPPVHIKLRDLTVTYTCDLPKSLWSAFQDDSVFIEMLHGKVNDLTNRLCDEWSKRMVAREREAREANGKGDKKGVEAAIAGFASDCDVLKGECATVAIEEINTIFTAKALTFGDYTRYKFKAGAKIVSTFVGLVVSVAAVSTAATPAAPATLVPALLGISSAWASIGNQLRGLAASAEEVEKSISDRLAGIELSYKDEKGKAQKGRHKAAAFAKGFASSVTGGWSDMKIPSIKALLDDAGLHKSKLDGLDVKLHEMGISANTMIDSLGAMNQVLQNNIDALTRAVDRKGSVKEVTKAIKLFEESHKAFGTMRGKFGALFETVPAMIKRIETGRQQNTNLVKTLEAINVMLGTKGYAEAGNLLAGLAMFATGFSSGLPSPGIEKTMTGIGGGMAAIDMLREYTPDAMEKILA